MKNRDGLDTNDFWQTPDWLYNKLNEEFNFDFDPCPVNPTFDGLSESTEWGKSNFINPPYNRVDKPRFIARTFKEFEKGKNCVLLIPAAMGTIQSHDLVLKVCKQRITWKEFLNDEYDKSKPFVIFMKGRISFKGFNTKGVYTEKNKGKHDSMIVVLIANN